MIVSIVMKMKIIL